LVFQSNLGKSVVPVKPDRGPKKGTPMPPARELRIVHSSDVHVDDHHPPGQMGGQARPDGLSGLRAVLASGRALAADVVLLAGDTFENHRLESALLAQAADLLAGAGRPVVILPGNHDPAIARSVFHRGGLAGLDNVHVLGVTHEEAVLFVALELEIWGHAHRDYSDMQPLRAPRPRTTRWQVAVAHGHYQPVPQRIPGLSPAWQLGDAEIAALSADYLALGHWNRAMQVGQGGVPAYYSGSPDLAGTVNLVRLDGRAGVRVSREILATSMGEN
jgi:DNA repair exonuclease SbcCD nuclease subunit